MKLIIDALEGLFIAAGGWSFIRRILRHGLIGVFLPRWLLNRRKKSDRPKPGGETYGHKFAPVSTLHGELPSPPRNHAWEVLVEEGERADKEASTLLLVCRLIDLPSGKVVASRSKDLIYYVDYSHWSLNNTYRTWEHRYSTGSGDSAAREVFVSDFVSWANLRKSEISDNSYSAGEYMMKGA